MLLDHITSITHFYYLCNRTCQGHKLYSLFFIGSSVFYIFDAHHGLCFGQFFPQKKNKSNIAQTGELDHSPKSLTVRQVWLNIIWLNSCGEVTVQLDTVSEFMMKRKTCLNYHYYQLIGKLIHVQYGDITTTTSYLIIMQK